MAYIRFLNSRKMIKCKVIPEGEHVVSLSFHKTAKVNTSGFNLYLDQSGTVDIGGDVYHAFQTVYRNDDVTAKYNGYQLSDDGSVYDPVGDTSEVTTELTEEELAEQKRQQGLSVLIEKIEDRKRQLSETDYMIVKQCEYALAGNECKGYDMEQVHRQRQALRDEINDLRQELKNLSGKE